MIYDWTFNPLTVKPIDGSMANVVITVDWRRTATDGPFLASAYGRVSLPPPQPSSFTPFGALTKEQVQPWVIAKLAEDTGRPDIVAQMDSVLAENINSQKSPTAVAMAPPWGE